MKKRFHDCVMDDFCTTCRELKSFSPRWCFKCRWKPTFWKIGNDLVDLIKEMINEEQEQKRTKDDVAEKDI